MKTLKRIFVLMAFFAVLGSSISCTKQDLNENEVLTNPEDSTNPKTPVDPDPDNGEG